MFRAPVRIVGALTEVVARRAAADGVAASCEIHVLLGACGGLSNRRESVAIDAMNAADVTCGTLASLTTA